MSFCEASTALHISLKTLVEITFFDNQSIFLRRSFIHSFILIAFSLDSVFASFEKKMILVSQVWEFKGEWFILRRKT